MSTAVIEQTTELTILEQFEVTKQQIAEAVALANKATVDGPDDKEGMKLAHDYRIGLKNMRIAIDKKGKELREDAVQRQKLVLKVTKELIEPIGPAESRLQELEDTAKREQARLDEIARHEREAEIKRRCQLATAIGWIIPIAWLQALPQADFDVAYAEKKAEFDAAEKAKAEAAEAMRLEQERIAKVAAEQKARQDDLDRKEAEQAARQKAIDDAEREAANALIRQRQSQLDVYGGTHNAVELQAMSAEQFTDLLAIHAARFEEGQKKEAEAERTRKEQEAKELEARIAAKAKEQAEQLERERLAAIEREKVKAAKERLVAERKAARAPDNAKILAFAGAVDAIAIPGLKDGELNKRFRTSIETFLAVLKSLTTDTE